MRSARRWLLASLLLLAAASPCLAAPLHPIGALVGIQDPARVAGNLSTDNVTSALWTPVSPPPGAPPLLEAPQARLTLHERRTTVSAHVVPKQVVFYGLLKDGPRESGKDLVALNVSVVGLEADPSWLARVFQGRFAAGADCSLLPERLEGPQRFHGFQVARGGLSTLRAECETSTIELEGRFEAFVWNSTVELTYRSPEDGTTRTERVRTGEWDEPNATVPQLTDHVTRLARITTSDPRAHGTWPGRGPLLLRAPALTLAGALTLPPFEGDLSWDGRLQNGSQQPLHAEGAFVFRSQDARLALDGHTLEAPGGARIQTASLSEARVRWALAVAAVAAAASAAWGLLTLFTRLYRGRLLEHPARQRLYDHVEARPGASLVELRSVLGGSRSATTYHLGVLVRAGLLVRRHRGRRTTFHRPADATRVEDPTIVARAKWEAAAKAALESGPAQGQRDLAARLGVSQGYVSRILGGLRRRGEVERVGGAWRLTRTSPSAPETQEPPKRRDAGRPSA
jgi:DNA-binding MarR family transcriptional regulator